MKTIDHLESQIATRSILELRTRCGRWVFSKNETLMSAVENNLVSLGVQNGAEAAIAIMSLSDQFGLLGTVGLSALETLERQLKNHILEPVI